jgi:alpha-tubulin suppressor-like RCC1 family protein
MQDQFVDVSATMDSLAAIRSNGTVVTWGVTSTGGYFDKVSPQNRPYVENSDYGGDSSAVKDQLVDVSAIYSTWVAFAALRNDGTVVT